jgi:LytS/YehU family sensor histidine kinase
MGRYFWDEMRKKSAIEIKNARLELELLKGHIQPHFLLNSLNSIVAWIEEDPKIASKLVNELSKELRLLMAFAGRENVSLMEEVSLCKAHIEVMNLRKEKKINLEIDGNIDGIIIPPLILHTALENGITHGFIKKDTGTFYLKTEKSAKSITVLLENDGDNKITRNKKSSGTGNKYIIQRLSEVYGENFKFVSQPKDGGWQVVFEIPEGKK